jgi:hypothetical protein
MLTGTGRRDCSPGWRRALLVSSDRLSGRRVGESGQVCALDRSQRAPVVPAPAAASPWPRPPRPSPPPRPQGWPARHLAPKRPAASPSGGVRSSPARRMSTFSSVRCTARVCSGSMAPITRDRRCTVWSSRALRTRGRGGARGGVCGGAKGGRKGRGPAGRTCVRGLFAPPTPPASPRSLPALHPRPPMKLDPLELSDLVHRPPAWPRPKRLPW